MLITHMYTYTWTHWTHYTSAAASNDLPSANLPMKPETKMAKDPKLNHMSWCGEMPRYDLIWFSMFFQQYENEYINTIWNRIYIMNMWYAILGYMTDIWQLQWISDTSYSSVWYDISPVYAMYTHLRTSEITIFLQTSALRTVPGNPSVRDALDKVARTGRAGPIYITRQLWKNGALFCCTTTCVAADFRGANLWK